MHDNTEYIPNILAYAFIGLFLVLLSFIVFCTSHKIYSILNKRTAKETIGQLIVSSALKINAEKHLPKSHLNLIQNDSQLKQLRKSKLG